MKQKSQTVVADGGQRDKGSESWECSSNSPRYGEGWDVPPRPLFSNEGLIPRLLGARAADCPQLPVLSRIAQSGTELSFSGLGPFLPRGNLHTVTGIRI